MRHLIRGTTLAAALTLGGTLAAQEPLPPPATPPVAPAPAALSVAEFARVFQPLPGNYEVTLIHPRTGCPVTVNFSLPAGYCVTKVKATRHSLRFDIDHRRDVVIEFRLNGKVDVRGL
jgi:hypothetical protein